MRAQTIVYVTDMGRSRDWYRSVLAVAPSYESDMWTPFHLSGAVIALHRSAELASSSRVDLSLVSDEPLERVADRLRDSGIDIARGISDEAFGRSLLLRDPDGTAIQINEHH